VRSRAGEHFDRTADRFDAIYEDEKPFVQRAVDYLFRRVVRVRYKKIFDRYRPGSDRRVLDIGCGAGRYSGRFYAQGARHVVGIDEAPAMIRSARERSRLLSGPGALEYILGEFLATPLEGPFDVALAVGYFDYIKDPAAHLRKIRSLLANPEGELAASFPKRWTFRTPVRKVRLTLGGCPVYFYSRPEIERLFTAAGFENLEIHCLSRDYLAFAS
jgi:SAM-dependent methyltransferase